MSCGEERKRSEDASFYTSLYLSRALKEAGLRQETEKKVWYFSATKNDWKLANTFYDYGGKIEVVRALDLGEVVDEIEWRRGEHEFSLGTATGTRGVTWVASLSSPLITGTGTTAVEAAGQLLLKIMLERKYD